MVEVDESALICHGVVDRGWGHAAARAQSALSRCQCRHNNNNNLPQRAHKEIPKWDLEPDGAYTSPRTRVRRAAAATAAAFECTLRHGSAEGGGRRQLHARVQRAQLIRQRNGEGVVRARGCTVTTGGKEQSTLHQPMRRLRATTLSTHWHNKQHTPRALRFHFGRGGAGLCAHKYLARTATVGAEL